MSATITLPTQTTAAAIPTGPSSASDLLPAPASEPTTPKGLSPGRDQTTGTDHIGGDTHSQPVGSGPTSAPAATSVAALPMGGTSRRDADLLLYLFADQLDDVEALRIATENRLRTLFSDDEWGKGVRPDLPEAKVIIDQLDQLRAVEHGVTLALQRAMRAHYLGPWCKQTVGIGEKQLGRLLAVIGDPATREKPSQLWAYCGLHVLHPGQRRRDTHTSTAGVDPTSDPGQLGHATHAPVAGVAPSRQRGQQANWSTEAKTRTYLIAESCMKQRTSPFRKVYDDGRAKYTDSLHQHPCKRCGPAGKPAEVGSPLSLGHQHARAMRLVMKAVLLDLWKQAHATGTEQT
jgi:hypothetical protein